MSLEKAPPVRLDDHTLLEGLYLGKADIIGAAVTVEIVLGGEFVGRICFSLVNSEEIRPEQIAESRL
ncbi:hypothetical protein [Fodinibius sp.]|uniref:hypothetical protein n=1 Tax=Fodinibius sp. TaxID=1872440 RepID=UPI002ACE2296|nr:hypothetical protein [Fodinibius sp.]MDZ7660317.1 hypothetical protein [Fodinibius sp.]